MGIAEELRYAAVKLVNTGKFAVGSAVSQVGLQVKGELKGSRKKNVVMVEEMMQLQAKLERVQQDIMCNGDSEEHRLKRLFDEPLNTATPQVVRARGFVWWSFDFLTDTWLSRRELDGRVQLILARGGILCG